MPTCVESAGDDRLWKGVGEKKQVQQSGAMRTGLLDGKKAAIPGIFTARFRFFLKKREVFLCFQVLIFRGSDLFGGGLLILVIGYLGCCFFFSPSWDWRRRGRARARFLLRSNFWGLAGLGDSVFG